MRNIYLLLILFLVVVVAFGITADQILAQDYAYEIEIQVDNATSTAYTAKRVQIEDFQAFYLIDNGYLQADADDVYTANGDVCATTLAAGTSTWFYSSVTNYPKYSSNILKIQIGNPTVTSSQVWPCVEDDFSRVWESASLDLDGSTGVQLSADALLYNLPTMSDTTMEGSIIGRPGAYELYFNGTPEAVFRVYDTNVVAAGTQIFYPDNTCLSDGVFDVACFTGPQTKTYGVKMLPTHPQGSEIYLRAQVRYDTVGAAGTVRVGLLTESGTINWSNTKAINNNGWIWTGMPILMENGENWSMYELLNRIKQVRITITGASTRIAELRIGCGSYTQPDTEYRISLPVTTGTTHSISGFYDNNEISITVDGTTNSQALSFGLINQNNDYLIYGKFDGTLDDVKVSTGSPAFTNDELDLTMEAEDIDVWLADYYSVDDHSGHANTGYMYLPTNDGLGITYLGMTSTSVATTLIPGAGVPAVLRPVNITEQSEEREDGTNNPLYNLFMPFVTVLEDLGTPVDITMFWYMFYIGLLGFAAVLVGRYLPDLRIIAIATMIVTFVFWMWGPISIFIVILHFIVVLFSLARETQRSPI